MANIPAYQQQVESRPLPTPYSAPDVNPGELGAAQGAALQYDAGVTARSRTRRSSAPT
jgi:hypothetical protein